MRPSPSTAQQALSRAARGAAAASRPQTAVLLDVPSTVTPDDVLRALRASGAVDARTGLSSLTPLPVGAARPALTTTYHIQVGPGAPALARRLASRPLFHGAGRAPTPTGGRPARGGSGDAAAPGLRDPGAVATTHQSGFEWAEKLLQKNGSSAWAKLREPVPPIKVEWATNPAASGRRVVVHGLPGRVPADHVAQLAGDLVGIVVDGEDAPRPQPPSPWALSSSWIITADSVADAHALARQLNMNYFRTRAYGKQFLMRASVVW